MTNYLEFAKSLALECGVIIKKAYHLEPDSVEYKSSVADLVTQTDKDIEELSKKRIFEAFPDHKFIGEESAVDGQSYELTNSPTWILDPIDGTTNFVSKFPYCCYSLGFYINEQAQVAVIYNGVLEDFYFATKGGGAYHNNQRIHVSSNEDLKSSLIVTDWGNDRDTEKVTIRKENITTMLMNVRGIRSMGSAALHLCLVASGACDAFFEYGIHCWDIAAGRLIVEEAGGCCTMINGSPLSLMGRQILACANMKLTSQITPLIKEVHYPWD